MLIFIWFWWVELMSVVVMIWWNCHNLFMDWEYSSSFLMSDYNFFMVWLLIILYLMMQSTSSTMNMSMNFLFILLFFLLQVSSWLVFYFFYEMIFIFIMFVIMVLGYSYERLSALYLMMFYSFAFSSPCMMLLLIFDYSFLMKSWMTVSAMVMWFMVASFMVKFPIFGFHYWLPVAHVEASTIGSMLLAGILLKMGGMGLFYLVAVWMMMVKFHWLVLALLLVMILILNLSDLKMMIAYSSIAHMTLVFYVMNLGSWVGKKGALMMMIYHGFISPLMFWLIGIFAWWKTRSLMVMKYISISYLFFLIIFFLMILNMSFPPFLGFLSEILMLKSMVNLNWILFLASVSVLFSCYYNIYLMWSFIGSNGWVLKVSVMNLDVYLFMALSVFLNF